MIELPGSPFGVAWFFLFGHGGVPAVQYMPQLRELGGGFTKVYLFWQQVEPEKGHFDWSAVDAFVDQLKSPEEGLISVFSSSAWAVDRPSAMLPPSPAKDLGDYYRFIHALVSRCRGRVRYWENDAEPNNPVFWAGSREQFVEQLRVFHRAVKDADPEATVVVGGYDGMFVPPGMTPLPGQRTAPFPRQEESLAFFDYVLKEGASAFDLFDLRLYGDPYTIVPRLEYMRSRMRAYGYEKPAICTEYGGPNLFEFPENRCYTDMVSAWSAAVGGNPVSGSADPATRIREMYTNMSALPEQTQMFMQGCRPELDAKYQRIQSRSIVMRNLFALSAGVQKTLYWDLLQADTNPYDLMSLMYGKIGLLRAENGALGRRTVSAETFARMTAHLAGVQQVNRIVLPQHPSVFLFQVRRGNQEPVYVAWERRDAFHGEDLPALQCQWDWAAESAKAVDIFGAHVQVCVRDGKIGVPVSVTPVYISPAKAQDVL